MHPSLWLVETTRLIVEKVYCCRDSREQAEIH